MSSELSGTPCKTARIHSSYVASSKRVISAVAVGADALSSITFDPDYSSTWFITFSQNYRDNGYQTRNDNIQNLLQPLYKIITSFFYITCEKKLFAQLLSFSPLQLLVPQKKVWNDMLRSTRYAQQNRRNDSHQRRRL